MSVVKRCCGEALTARLEPTQQAQALLTGLAYNVQHLGILGSSSSGFRQSKALLEHPVDSQAGRDKRTVVKLILADLLADTSG